MGRLSILKYAVLILILMEYSLSWSCEDLPRMYVVLILILMEYSLREIALRWPRKLLVLILILMEYSLRKEALEVFNAKFGLNPYSNGILSERRKVATFVSTPYVLILILMEYSLSHWQRACYVFLTFTILQKSLLFLRELVLLEWFFRKCML